MVEGNLTNDQVIDQTTMDQEMIYNDQMASLIRISMTRHLNILTNSEEKVELQEEEIGIEANMMTIESTMINKGAIGQIRSILIPMIINLEIAKDVAQIQEVV